MNIYENKLKLIKLRYVAVLFILMFISGCTLNIVNVLAVRDSSNDWSWTSGVINAYSSKNVSEINAGYCDGVMQSVSVHPLLDNKLACIKNNGTIKIGFYYDGNLPKYIISYPFDSIYYGLSFPCYSVNECLYVPGSDSLIMKQNLINGYVKSLVIYKNVSERIKLTVESTLQFKYYFDNSNPDYIFQNPDGYEWPIGDFSASDNGDWLAVELRDRGIGLLNLRTLKIKRVSSNAIRYGYGFDPTTEFAVSDSGKQVVQMGLNSGLSIIDLTNECGDPIDDNYDILLNSLKKPCAQANINFESFIEHFRTAYYPRLSSDGAELSFFANSYTVGPKEVVLRANNFAPQRVDYLALGDSYTSGEGESDDSYYLPGTNVEFEKCHVSSRSYPFLIGQRSGIDPNFIKSVACSGAKTKDIIADGKKYNGQGDRLGLNGLNLDSPSIDQAQIYAKYNFLQGRILQNDFVKQYQPNIITVGIGGNDVDLVGKLKSCIGPGVCNFAKDDDSKQQVAEEIKSLYPKLIDTYSKIQENSKKSKIFVIGYPRVIDESGSCGALINGLIQPEEKKFFNESIKYMNQVIEAAAKTVGVKYIENFETFGDSTICGSNNKRAINFIRLGDDVGLLEKNKWTRFIGFESFHPNPTGFEMIADNIVANVGNLTTANICSNGENICPVPTAAPNPSDYWGKIDNQNLSKLISADLIEPLENATSSLSRQIKIESYSLQPKSIIEISVYSNKINLGEYHTDENGGFDKIITLPHDLEYGYHTLHVTGKSFSGEDVDLYQSIEYIDPEHVTEVSSSLKPVILRSEAKTAFPSSEEIINSGSEVAYGFSRDSSRSDLQLDNSAVKGAMSVKHKHKNRVLFSSYYIVVVALLTVAVSLICIVRRYRRYVSSKV